MFISLFVGSKSHAQEWCQSVCRRASDVGIRTASASFSLRDGRAVEVVHQVFDSAVQGNFVSLSSNESTVCISLRGLEGEGLSAEIQLADGKIVVDAPVVWPGQMFYAVDHRGTSLSSDQLVMVKWMGLDLDDRAVFALFRYSAIPAPLTLSRNIKRIPNGHTLTLRDGVGEVIEPRYTHKCNGRLADEECETSVIDVLDAKLRDVPKSSVLLFSGGVDSSLLASRLAAQGRTDVRLFNFSFGQSDAEAMLAKDIASRFGMECVQINDTAALIGEALDNLTLAYSYPYADVSTVPTHSLVSACFRSLGDIPAIIDGTGADGAFAVGGNVSTYNKLTSMPVFPRLIAAKLYGAAGLWRKKKSRVERIGRTINRSLYASPELAQVAVDNPLNGIAYRVPSDVDRELQQAIEGFILGIARECEQYERASFLDLVHVCAGRFAAKTFGPVFRNGAVPCYPFLNREMLALASSMTMGQKCQGGVDKGILKSALSKALPRELVYRQKSGFLPPFHTIMNHPKVQDTVRDVLLSGSPVMQYCDARMVKRMLSVLGSEVDLSPGANTFVWSLLVLTQWIESCKVS